MVFPVEDLDYEIGALYAFFSTDIGEVFGGGGAYDIADFVDEIISYLRPALLDLLEENPNRTMSLVIDTDDHRGLPSKIQSSPGVEKQ